MKKAEVFVLRNEQIVRRALDCVRRVFEFSRTAANDVVFEVVVRVYESRRSIEQNRLYWAVLRDISEQFVLHGMRYTPDELHESLKLHFLGSTDYVDPCTGEIRRNPLSTTDLKTGEFSDYVTQVMAWAADRGIEFSEQTERYRLHNGPDRRRAVAAAQRKAA